MSKSFLFAPTVIALSGIASAQFSFDPVASYSAPTRPDSATAADFDGDGDVDLAVGTDTPDKVSFFFNDGSGTFGAAVNVLTGAGTGPGVSAAGDFDGDGDMDLAVCLKNIDTVRLLVNTAGVFSLGATVGTGGDPRHIAKGDLDGDGDLDLVTSNRDDDTLSVLVNQGNGTFLAAPSLAAGGDPRSVVLVDLDGDGDQDAAVASQDTRELRLFTNSGGSLAPSGSLPVSPALRPDGVAAGDFDGDGDNDLATSTETSVSVFTNLGGGSFSGAVTFASGGLDSSDLATGDFNVDGDLDLVVVNNELGNVALLAGAAGATFGAPMTFGAGVDPDGLAVADLSGSASDDFAFANTDSNTVSVYLNQVLGEQDPVVYCTPKTSSAGCDAMISTSAPNMQPVSGSGGYSVMATGVQGLKPGLLFAGISGPANTPFNGGVLCVAPPLQRGPLVFSNGTGASTCDGAFATTVNDGNLIPGGLDAGSGNAAWYQYWYRDPNASGSTPSALSNAVQLDFQ